MFSVIALTYLMAHVFLFFLSVPLFFLLLQLHINSIFKYLRHPNYLGEMIGWSANTMCGLIAGTAVLVHLAKAGGIMYSAMTVSILAPMLGSILGWIGIMFVLLNATTNLEKNQQERYCTNNNNNNSEKYRSWIQSSWKGLTFSLIYVIKKAIDQSLNVINNKEDTLLQTRQK